MVYGTSQDMRTPNHVEILVKLLSLEVSTLHNQQSRVPGRGLAKLLNIQSRFLYIALHLDGWSNIKASAPDELGGPRLIPKVFLQE
jgi:hypothetical protein